MQEVIEKIYRNFIDFFAELTFSKKLSVIGIISLIVGVFVYFVIWASKTHYEVLYTDLNREDSKQLALLLEDKSIPYQTTEDGVLD